MAGSTDSSRPPKMRQKDYDNISRDFTDLTAPRTEIQTVTVPPRRRKYFELAYSENIEKCTTHVSSLQTEVPSSSASLKPNVSVTLPSSETTTPCGTPNTTPHPSPRPSPKFSRAVTGSLISEEPSQNHASSSGTQDAATKKWFGFGSLFDAGSRGMPPQKAERYLPNPEIKKQIEEKLKLYPLPPQPEFFHQKEDSIFMQTVPKQLQALPRKTKKKRTTDKDLNIIAPNTF